jgi:hypothetical protein
MAGSLNEGKAACAFTPRPANNKEKTIAHRETRWTSDMADTSFTWKNAE